MIKVIRKIKIMIRRIFAVGVLGLALVACNDNKKTEKKINPETGKEEIVEVVEEVAESKKAISDSAGVFTQKFILEVGKTYPFTSTQKEVQTAKDPTGKSMSGTQEIIDTRNIVVEKFEDGVYDLKLNVVSKRMSSKVDGKTIVVDTNQSAPKDENLKGIWTINSALAGSSFGVKMRENGEIISISGIDAIYKKLEKAITPLIKDANHRKQFLDNFKLGFNEAMIKEEFSKGINILPKKGVKIGESWSETEQVDAEGKIKNTITYTLTKVENGVAEIKVKGGIPKKSEKQTREGITATMSIEGSQNGTIKLDENTGWIQGSKMNTKTINKQSFTDGKTTESGSMTTDISITIN